MKKIKLFVLMVMTVLFAVSCDFKDIEEAGMGRLDINFDFSRVDSVPKAVKIFFYPVSGNAVDMIKQGYTTMDWTPSNTRITLPSGVYNITAFSIDGEHVFYTGETKRETLRLTTDSYIFGEATRAAKSPLEIVDSIYPGQDLKFTPNYVVRANENLFYVDDYQPVQKLTLQADSITTSVRFTIKGVDGLQFVTDCEGVIGGLALYGNPTPGGVAVDSTAMGFPMVVKASENEIKADFQVWGIDPANAVGDMQHKLTIFFWMDDAKVFVTADVTEEMRNAKFENGVMLVDIQLDMNVRESVGGSGGFDIELDPWEDIEVDVGM